MFACVRSASCADAPGTCGPVPAGTRSTQPGVRLRPLRLPGRGLHRCGRRGLRAGRKRAGLLADVDCDSGLCACDTPECPGGLCGPQANGAPCERNKDCQSGDCDLDRLLGGNCGPFADGYVCTRDKDCTNGNCLEGRCHLKSNGQACTADTQCASTLCRDALCEDRQPDGEEFATATTTATRSSATTGSATGGCSNGQPAPRTPAVSRRPASRGSASVGAKARD